MIVGSHIRLPSRMNGCIGKQPSLKYFSIRLWCDGIPIRRIGGYFGFIKTSKDCVECVHFIFLSRGGKDKVLYQPTTILSLNIPTLFA